MPRDVADRRIPSRAGVDRTHLVLTQYWVRKVASYLYVSCLSSSLVSVVCCKPSLISCQSRRPQTTAEPEHLQTFLDNASVSPEVFNLCPDYRALLLILDGIIPGASDSTSETRLQGAESSAPSELAKHATTSVAHVASWREAYESFRSKPNRTHNNRSTRSPLTEPWWYSITSEPVDRRV